MAIADPPQRDHAHDLREELGAIVQATEAATNAIMECAETVLAADTADPVAYRTLVEEKMLAVFEACSFQDITGQRIARVVESLRPGEYAGVERRKRLLLHGPQPAANANAQRDVDLLLKRGAGKAAQSDVDALFE
jgi:chemotaxis protein CheZ